MANWVSDNKKIGVGLTGFGCLFLLLGVLFFFDRALLALGNLLFITGITLLIGTKKTLKFFSSPAKLRGTICFVVGILLSLFGYPIIGMCVEFFGIVNLFGNFFPFVLAFMRRLPVCGAVLRLPGLGPLLDRCAGQDFLLPTSSKDYSY